MENQSTANGVFECLPSTSNEDEIVYDATQIEELDHFDIGDDSNGGDMAAEDVTVWPSGEGNGGKTRTKGRLRGRSGTGSQVVHILNPRRMPNRRARVKSFRHLIEDNLHSDSGEIESEVMSSSKEDAVSRIFVSNDIPGQHLEWTLYSMNPESFAVVAYVLLTDAEHVKPEQICSTVPQEFTGMGTFLIDMSQMRFRHQLNLDALGSWGSPNSHTKFFRLNSNRTKALACTEADYTMRVLCNRYIHPGTDSRGFFIKKTYTGFSREDVPSMFGVVVYEWEGTPHPVSVAMDSMPHMGNIRDKPFGSRSWEANPNSSNLQHDEGATYRGQPVFARVTIDLEAACRILLAAFHIHENRICTRVPQQFKECGTFVLDISRCGGERAIGKDGREWNKPSGSSRFFRFDAEGKPIRVNSTAPSPTPPQEDYDVQIIAKRYETIQQSNLVRKIFIAREKDPPRVNSTLAIVTYLYRPSPDTKSAVVRGKVVPLLNSRKRTTPGGSSAAPDSTVSSSRGNTCVPSDTPITRTTGIELRRLTIAKQAENINRMSSFLDRSEAMLDRFEQAGTQLHLPLVRQMVHEWQQGGEEVVVTSEDVDVEENEDEIVVDNRQPVQLPPGFRLQYDDQD